MKNNKKYIGKCLKEVRLTFGISQKKLGILAGIDGHSASARMNQHEVCTHVPNFLTLQNIGKALGYPVAFFTSDDDLIAEIIYLVGKLPEVEKQKILNTAKNLVSHYREKLKNESTERELSLTEK